MDSVLFGQFRAGMKFLIVDDVPDLRIVLEYFLRSKGAEVLTASNGANAIEIALKERPDLILMDMQLPDIDGPIVIRILKEKKFTAPIIAVTGRAQSGEREMFLRAGCVDYITKPIDLNHLLSTIKRHLPVNSVLAS